MSCMTSTPSFIRSRLPYKMNAQAINCPRANKICGQNLVNHFQNLFKEFVIVSVQGLDSGKKPYCVYQITFNEFIIQRRMLSRRIRREIDLFKPPNTKIISLSCDATNQQRWILDLGVVCNCQMLPFFRDANKDCKTAFLISMSMIKNLSNSATMAQLNNSERKLETENEIESNKKQRMNTEEFQRVRKRKFAMMFGYLGQNYQEMQKNPETKTIESELFYAMKKAGIIPEDYNDLGPNLIQFQRGSRTDKGVSAVRQVVSLKLPENADIAEINKHLSDQIRVFSLKRVTKGFNSKFNCDARTYSYTMPSYAFAPGKALSILEDYRISLEEIDGINDVLKIFLGTHNFHNFTTKKIPSDPSAKPYIMSFSCDDVFINKYEFITLKIQGQSFMLHQIRKMVAYTIAMIKGLVPENVAANIFSHTKYNVPMVPGLGLLLEEIHYRKYDSKYGKDGVHENLEWADVNDEVQKFKREKILPSIIETETKGNPIFEWLECLNEHDFTNLDRNVRDEDTDEPEDFKKEDNIKEENKNEENPEHEKTEEKKAEAK